MSKNLNGSTECSEGYPHRTMLSLPEENIVVLMVSAGLTNDRPRAEQAAPAGSNAECDVVMFGSRRRDDRVVRCSTKTCWRKMQVCFRYMHAR